MPRPSNLSSPEYNISKTVTNKIKDWLGHTLSAVVMVTPLLVMSALENNTLRESEKYSEWNISLLLKNKTMSPTDIERQSPEIIANNQAIFEFLGGDLNENDTNLSIQLKLKKTIEDHINDNMYDDFIFEVHSEIVYCQATGKPEPQVLLRGLGQFEKEKQAISLLGFQISKLETKDLGDINELVINYYNTIWWKEWQEEDLWKWRNELDTERSKLHYSYADVVNWMVQYEILSRNSKEKNKQSRIVRL